MKPFTSINVTGFIYVSIYKFWFISSWLIDREPTLYRNRLYALSFKG